MMTDFLITPEIHSVRDIAKRRAFELASTLEALVAHLTKQYGTKLKFYPQQIPGGCDGVAVQIVGANAYSREKTGFYECKVKLSGRSVRHMEFMAETHRMFLGFPALKIESMGVVFDRMEIDGDAGVNFFHEMYCGRLNAMFEMNMIASIDLLSSIFEVPNISLEAPGAVVPEPFAVQLSVLRLLEVELDLVENESIFSQEIGRNIIGGVALNLSGFQNTPDLDVMEYRFNFFGRDTDEAKLYSVFQRLYALSRKFSYRQIELPALDIKIRIAGIYPLEQVIFKNAGHDGKAVITGCVPLIVVVKI